MRLSFRYLKRCLFSINMIRISKGIVLLPIEGAYRAVH